MFQTLWIRNFKGWEDTGNIKLAPLTLFFGANSSGKSSIAQFMMLLKQTAESQDRKAVLNPGNVKTAVDVGSYQDMVYKHNVTHNIKFSYSWKSDETIPLEDGDINVFKFDGTIGINDKKNATPVLKKFSYEFFEDETDENTSRNVKIGLSQSQKESQYDLVSSGYDFKRKSVGRAWPIREVIRFYGFPDDFFNAYQDTAPIQLVQHLHEKLFAAISYLGPLRTKTDRIYTWSGINPESVGYAGEQAIMALLSAKDRKFNYGHRRHYKEFEIVIAEQLEVLGLIDAFKVNSLEQRQQYEVKVKVKGSESFVDLPDVGFGVSQVLPVLVQAFYAPKNSVIIMEQPEIHLHPRAQSALADVLIDVIKSRENGEDRNIQLIIETHSEHLLRRLQRRIAEEVISENEVRAYFADNSTSPSKLEALEIDAYGRIANWPEDFFGDEMGDLAGQTKATIERMKEGRHA